MADEKKSKKSQSKSKGKTKKGGRKGKKSIDNLKRPQTPYFLFCSKQRDELKKKGDDKKLTAKELGDMWKKLSDEDKKPFIDKYQEEKKKYEKLKDELGNKSEEEDSDVEVEDKKEKTKKSSKAKAKTKKAQVEKNNSKACNCGKCAECKKRKGKKKAEKADDEEEED